MYTPITFTQGQIIEITTILGAILSWCLARVWKLIKKRPKLKKELERFAIPTDLYFINYGDTNLALNISSPERDEPKSYEMIPINLKVEEPKEEPKIETEELKIEFKVEEKHIEIIDSDWYKEQKEKALVQLQPYGLQNVGFTCDPKFKVQGYALDAFVTLKTIIEKNFRRKKDIVFYLSPNSDGIYHKRENNVVTIQVWSSQN